MSSVPRECRLPNQIFSNINFQAKIGLTNQGRDHAFCCAKNGSMALRGVQAAIPDLILLDIQNAGYG